MLNPLFRPLFTDHRIIGPKFRSHSVIEVSGFQIEDPGNRLYLPRYAWLARRMGITFCRGEPLDSYTDGQRDILDRLQTTDAFELACSGNAAAKALLLEEVTKLSFTMKTALVKGKLFTNALSTG
jgi:hypothetical protein